MILGSRPVLSLLATKTPTLAMPGTPTTVEMLASRAAPAKERRSEAEIDGIQPQWKCWKVRIERRSFRDSMIVVSLVSSMKERLSLPQHS